MKNPFLAAIGAAGLSLACGIAPGEARPVSYPGGVTVMQRNTGDFSSLHVHYSPTFRSSVGLYAERNWDEDVQFAGLQANRLLKRWNAPKSQGNLYLKLGAGAADPFGEDGARRAGFVEIAADWETRRWFTSYEVRASDFGGDASVRQWARIGVAPYVGEYGDLHTWAMVQLQHAPEAGEPVTATPLLRFFYGVQLMEVGYTPQTEEFLFNYVIRF
ncbi:MAG: hypothetical protein AAGC95_08570 [Pseudomonadota bacterium]